MHQFKCGGSVCVCLTRREIGGVCLCACVCGEWWVVLKLKMQQPLSLPIALFLLVKWFLGCFSSGFLSSCILSWKRTASQQSRKQVGGRYTVGVVGEEKCRKCGWCRLRGVRECL